MLFHWDVYGFNVQNLHVIQMYVVQMKREKNS